MEREKDITEMRIEDLIQSEFDKETRSRGYAVPNRNSEEEKAKTEEEKAIFLWLMPLIHQNKLEQAVIWLNAGLALEHHKSIQRIDYNSKNLNKIVSVFNSLLRKMEATGKVQVLKRTGSHVELMFDFRSKV